MLFLICYSFLPLNKREWETKHWRIATRTTNWNMKKLNYKTSSYQHHKWNIIKLWFVIHERNDICDSCGLNIWLLCKLSKYSKNDK